MSSIAERIRQNSALCIAGKDLIEEAIINKGGNVPENPDSGVPTFANLVEGVNSIKTGSTVITAGNGAKSMEALAQENISQYDPVKVLVNPNAESTQFIGYTLPSTAKYDIDETDSTYKSVDVKFYTELQTDTSTDYKMGYMSPTGNFVCLTHTGITYDTVSDERGVYPFYKVNGEYVQLKINGLYQPFKRYAHDTDIYNLTGIYTYGAYIMQSKNPIGIDEKNNIIVTMYGCRATFYQLDLENLNITKIKTVVVGQSNISTTTNPILVNKALFFEARWYTTSNKFRFYKCDLDDDYNVTSTENKLDISGVCKIIGYSVLPDKVYVAVLGSGTHIFCYSLNNETGKATFVNSTKMSTGASINNTYKVPNGFAINSSGTKAFVINTNKLYSFLLTETDGAFTFTDVSSADFTDSTFDYTNVANAYISRDGNYILAEINDTSLSYADRVVMLEYQFGETGGYKVIGYPLKDWSPALKQASLPLLNCLLQFNDGQNMIFETSSGSAMVYKATAPTEKYIMLKSGNALSSESNLYGFGIAEKSVAIGETGVASLNVVRTI